ncbi:hypothetical protein ACMFDP_02005 [Klebsiella pneumoniae]|uniref:hypothetical protein n=1 Tax=Klebsiella pneumoniae TaxID=573 RepID=UPI003CE87820
MKKISLPKIGIRPVIDGRRMGVRESLEAQTMNMAKATAALISEKLRHACGARVECVIADTCIAGMAESAACEEKFSSQNVGVTITVTPCWCYGSETIDMDPLRPKAIWGFNGTERPGAVYLAAALAAHSQKGIPAFSIYGHDVQDADDTSIPADVEEKLLRFARAGLAVASMKGKSYLSLGGVSMGIAAGFQGQRHWTDQYPNGDTAEALLNSSFDWNGVREPFVVATENDSLNGVAMLMGHQLTGTAQVFADVRTYWSPDAVERVTGQPLTGRAEHGIIHLINSGSAALDGSCQQRDAQGNPTMKPHWEIEQSEADACLAATEWCPAIHEYFRGGGFSSRFLTEGGVPFTMTRVNIIKGLGPVLQIAEGWSVALPKAMHDQLDARTNSTWPTTWFAPRLTGKGPFSDVYSVMANWGANHGVLTIGHVGADFITLAAMLRIPVCMHNVEEAKIYRPSAWAAHGMDIEGQDYRACQNYGPLYKR